MAETCEHDWEYNLQTKILLDKVYVFLRDNMQVVRKCTKCGKKQVGIISFADFELGLFEHEKA